MIRAGVRIDSMIGISVGISQVQATVRHIAHHRTQTFQEENLTLPGPSCHDLKQDRVTLPAALDTLGRLKGEKQNSPWASALGRRPREESPCKGGRVSVIILMSKGPSHRR